MHLTSQVLDFEMIILSTLKVSNIGSGQVKATFSIHIITIRSLKYFSDCA